MAGCMTTSAMAARLHQAAASVSIPSGLGCLAPSCLVGTAWKHRASCWWMLPSGSTSTCVGRCSGGEPGELDGDAGLFGDLADHGLGHGLADLDSTARQLPVAVIDPTDHQNIAGAVTDRRERRREDVVRARRVRILVVLLESHHSRILEP